MRGEKNRAAYLKDYRKYGTLSPVQESALLSAVQSGNAAKEQLEQHTVRFEDIAAARRDMTAGKQAREKLVLAYLPFLTLIARRYSYPNISADDLIQESLVGLLKDIDCYRGGDLDLPAVIVTQVKRAIHRMFAERDMVKLPDNILSAIRKVRSVMQCLERSMGHAYMKDIADEMEIPPAIVRKLLYYISTRNTVSLDAPASDGSDNTTLTDFLAADGPTPDEQVEREDLRERVREILATLEPVEESAIRLRFGFVGGEIYSAEETAEELTLSLDEEQRVEIRAMRKLRHPSRSTFLRGYL